MMAVSAVTLPDGADWSYEVKWDGYRAQPIKQGPVVSLASRNLRTCALRCSSAFEILQFSRCPFANLPSTRTGHWGDGITADEMNARREPSARGLRRAA